MSAARRGLPVYSTARHAEALIDLLVEKGPLTRVACCEALGWTEGRFATALAFAREHLCPIYDVTIPAATPAGGWTYQVTDEWEAVAEGASFTMGGIETRLRGIFRDVQIVRPKLDQRTIEGRRANFLEKRLGHLLATLAEITK